MPVLYGQALTHLGRRVVLAQPSLFVFLAVVAGILAAETWALPLLACAASTALGLGVLGFAMWRRRGTVLAALWVVASAGAWAARQVPYPAPNPPICASDDSLWQVQIDAPIDRQIQGGQMHLSTAARLLRERCDDTWQPRTGRVRLALRPGVPVARGDRFAVRLRMHAPAVQHHAFELLPFERLRRQRLTHQAHVLSDHVPIASGSGILARIDRLRTRGAEAFEAGLVPTHAALAKALALGDTGALTPTQRDAWAAAGIAHLLSVSGLHVAMVAMIMSGLVRYVLGFLPGAGERYSLRALSAWCALAPVVGFCILTGAHPAAQRATIMACGALLGMALRYPSAVANAWGVAGAAMLIADPLALYDVGFILSFAAVGALVWLVRPAPHDAARAHTEAPAWRRWVHRTGQNLHGSWRVSFAATCVTAPITACVFNRVSWVAPAVNLVAVPIGSILATPWALGAAVVAPQDGWLQLVCMRPLGWVLACLHGIANYVGQKPWASLDVPPPTPWEVVLYAALVAAACAWQAQRRRAIVLATAASLALFCCIGARVAARTGDGHLYVRHIYVGQGDATLLTLPRGGTVLVDGGGSLHGVGHDPGRQAVAPTLRRLNVHRIDWMVLTHPHPDHINGLLHIASVWPVDHLLLAGGGIDFASVRQLQAQVTARGGKVVRLADMPKQTTWEGVAVSLLHPRTTGGDCYPALHLNDNSVVLRMQWGVRSILLAGDIEKRAEAMLVRDNVTADILKVGHHGSRTSSTLAFLQTLQPHTAVISCGSENQFGFPHTETLERLSMSQTRILRTDTEGTITLRTDGANWFASSVQHPQELVLTGADPR